MERIDGISIVVQRKQAARLFAMIIRLGLAAIVTFFFLFSVSNPAWATSYVLGEPSGTYYGPYNITGSATADSGRSLRYLNSYIDGVQATQTYCYSANCTIDYLKHYGYLYESLQGSHTYQLAAYDGTWTYSQKQIFFVDRTPHINITSPIGTVYGKYNLSGTVTFTPTRNPTKGSLYFYLDNSPNVFTTQTCSTEICNFDYIRADNQGTHTIIVRAVSGGADVSQTITFFSEITPTVHITGPEGTVSPYFDITGTVTFKPTLGTYKGYIYAYLDGKQVGSYQTCTTEACTIKRSAYPLPSEGTHAVQLYATTAYPYTANASDSKTINVQACSFSASNTTFDPSVGGSTTLSGTVYDSPGNSIPWTLTIAGRTFTGTGPTVSINWDGKDSTGKIVEPGFYTATLSTSTNTGACIGTKTTQVKVSEGLKTCLMNIPFLSGVNGASGNLSHDQELFYTKGTGLTTAIQLYYNSLDSYAGPLGIGWSHSYDIAVKENSDGSVVLHEGDSGRRLYTKSGTGYVAQTGDYATLTKSADGTFVVTHKDGLEYNFGLDGKIKSIVDLNNNAVTFTYTNGSLATITDSAGRVTTFTNSADGKITSIADPAGNIYSFGYSGNTLMSIAYPDGSQWSYYYDAAGFMQAKTDPGGNTINYSYDANHRVLMGTDIKGQSKSVTYPPVTDTVMTTTYTDKNGSAWLYTYDTQNGTLVKRTDPVGNSTLYAYDANKNLISETDSSANVTNYSYDTKGNMLIKTEAAGTALEKTASYTYHPVFNKVLTETVKSVVDQAQNRVITNTYDETTGNILTTVETGLLGDGTSYAYRTIYKYDANGRVTSIDRPRTDVQDVTTFTYDPSTVNLLTMTQPLIGTTTYDNYDLLGNPGTITDPNGNTTAFTYDSMGRVLTVTAPGDTSPTQYFYVQAGCGSCGGGGVNKIDHIILPEGNRINYSYDTFGNLITLKDNLGNSINYTYDAEGNRLKEEIKDASGALQKTLSYQYDVLNRLTKVINPDATSTFTQYTFDNLGNRMSSKDPKGNTTYYQYDALNRLIAVIQPGSIATSYTYNTSNNLTTVKDANDNTTTYKYDDKGRVYQVISPDTGTTTYAYDPAGNMLSKTDAKGVTISYVYDALNRLTKIDFPTDTDIVYVYDSCVNGKDRLCSMTDASGTTAYEYTPKGQVKKETKVIDSVQYITQYTYDMDGNLKTMTYPSGRVITYNYSNDRAVSVLNNAANLATNIQYKPFGGMTGLTYGNGLTGTISYDNQYRVSALTAGTAGTILNNSYGFDNNGNISSIAPGKAYTYDTLDRLSSATGPWGSLGWTYDGVGNRLTEGSNSYTYFSNTNKLSSANGKSFGYDNNGNTVTESSRQYTYSQNQRLIQVVDGAMTAGYTYNGNGQRVKKTVSGTTTVFHYSLSGQLIAESNSAGSITAEYVYLNSQPLAKIEGANVYYYHNDHLATPQKMTDSSGTVVWSADYKPFGEATVTVSTITNNLRFPGQYYDAETGLNYNYFRDYNPVIGRYVEPEPIGQRGHIALYPYAKQNPLGFYDPNGREAISATAGTLIIGGGTATAVATVGAVIAVGAGTYILTTQAIQGTWVGEGGIGNWIYDITHQTTPGTLVPSTVDQPAPDLSGSMQSCELTYRINLAICDRGCQSAAAKLSCKTRAFIGYLGCMANNLFM